MTISGDGGAAGGSRFFCLWPARAKILVRPDSQGGGGAAKPKKLYELKKKPKSLPGLQIIKYLREYAFHFISFTFSVTISFRGFILLRSCLLNAKIIPIIV